MVSFVRRSPHELAEYIDPIENNKPEDTDEPKAHKDTESYEKTEACKNPNIIVDVETSGDSGISVEIETSEGAEAFDNINFFLDRETYEDKKVPINREVCEEKESSMDREACEEKKITMDGKVTIVRGTYGNTEDHEDPETCNDTEDYKDNENCTVIEDHNNSEVCIDIEDHEDTETCNSTKDYKDNENCTVIEDHNNPEICIDTEDHEDTKSYEEVCKDTEVEEDTKTCKDIEAEEDTKTCKDSVDSEASEDSEVLEETEAFDDSETSEKRDDLDVEDDFKDSEMYEETVGWDRREEYEILDPTDPETIPKFVDPLPIPKIARPMRPYDSSKSRELFYKITMREAKHRFHKYFPLTTIFGYNGTYPGPTIEVPKDVAIKVKWENQLPKKHILPIDHTLHGTMDTPDVRTVIHLHGANVDADSDGHPEAWFSRDNEFVGQKYEREIYEYTNHQAGATLWYHDHALGITRLNVYSGLAGFYLIRDFLEERLNLPKNEYEIPIMIQDKTFNKDGSLFYPDNTTPPIDNPVPSTPAAFFGNTVVVNGKLWPYLEVEPRKYRFRILNASNLRSYTLGLSNGEVLHQIGTDQGLLHQPQDIRSFILEPAERIDLIVDFSKYIGQEIILQNTAQTPPSPGMEVIMKFIVGKEVKYPDTSTIPNELMPFHPIDPALAVKERTMILDETKDHYGRTLHLLNNRMWSDPATEKVKLDTIEIWHLVNNFNFPHPIHIHLVNFEILGRKVFTEDDFDEEGNYKFIPEDLMPPLDYETGPKDVVRAEPGQVTSIVMHFKEHTGDYVWHCHILEHEDNDMMRPLVVEK